MRVVSVDEMREIEDIAKSEFGFDEALIIENIGVQGSHIIGQVIDEQGLREEIVFLIGKGCNGSDAMAVARHLSNKGHRCRGFLMFPESDCSKELLNQVKMAKAYGVSINYIESVEQVSGYFQQMGSPIVVDGLFGTGVQLPLSNFMYDVISYVNDSALFIVAMDIPSGVESNTGAIQGNAILADMTLAIGFPKQGHYISAGAKYTGVLHTVDVGLPKDFQNQGNKYLLQPEYMLDLLSPRDKFADKKRFGHSLILGGSHGLTGAAALAGIASLKVGSGLVTVATWEPQYQELIPRLIPEIMYGYVPLDTAKWDILIKDLNKYSSIVIGPGLSRSARSRRLVLEVLNNFDGPVVIDADAINVLSYQEDKQVFAMRNAPTVLTPHFGEFCRFAGLEYEKLEQSPISYLREMVDNINCTVVLKGPCTFLGSSDGNTYFNFNPNDGMATGGVGDVLAGILGGLLGQEESLKEKTPLVQRYEEMNRVIAESIYIHSIAGKLAADKFGVRAMSARSLIKCLPDAFNTLEDSYDKIYREK